MITLKKNGLEKKVATGFSFKVLFFGCLYPLVTGDNKGAVIQFVLASLTMGLSWLVVPFTYNKMRVKRLIEDGYEPANYKSEEYLIKKVGYYA